MSTVLHRIVFVAGTAWLTLGAVHARRNWGATANEIAAALPGDELVPDPAENTTLGVTVAVPAEQVWPWLVQMGQDRGGMYSYDGIDNLFGLNIHSADQIHEEWQHVAPGDRVVVVPEGYRVMPSGYAFTVARVDPPRALVLRQSPPQHPWNGVWSFHVVPVGEARCRLLSRSRTAVPPQLGLRLASRIGEPVTLVMTSRMLHGIRQRAERQMTSAGSRTGCAERPPESVGRAPNEWG